MKTIAVGVTAPDFSLPDQRGRIHRLSTLLSVSPVVLFFYPVAGSTGCVEEVRHFRDLGRQFAAARAQRVGVSPDDLLTQELFSAQERLDFPLPSDAHGVVATAYGVRRRFLTPVKRTTFVIDRGGRIAEVITSELNMTVHADRALVALASIG